jgi:hypothetical protein
LKRRPTSFATELANNRREAMKLRRLFVRDSTDDAPADPIDAAAPSTQLDLDALDDCIGGRAETDGVGCYAHSTQPHLD